MANSKSTAPKSLKITRNNNKFVCEWTIPSSKYGDGQQFKSNAGGSDNITKTQTKHTVEVDLSRFNGENTVMAAFSFSVRGNSDNSTKKTKDTKGWSDWSSKEFSILPPPKPSVTTALLASNQCKFSWTVNKTEKDSHHPFHKVVIQTKLVKDCTWAPEDDDWKNATKYTSTDPTSSKTITEDNSTLAQGSYTRLFRIRAYGPGGVSAYTYKRHVYAAPNQSVQKQGEVQSTPGGYDIKVNWDTKYDKSTPIDETVVEWAIATPLSDMSCPDSGVTWNTGWTSKDTKKKESVHLEIDQRVGNDQCLWTRVNTKHDSHVTYGERQLQVIGPLSMPSGLSRSETSQEYQTAKITATNNSAVSGSVLEILYRKNEQVMTVGLIDGSPNYKTVKVPAWTDEDRVSFGVRAVLIKDMSYKTEDGVTIYTINPYMSSEEVWESGTVAVAPGELSLSKEDEDIRATWKNTWEDANLIELSWSDNPHAWESTDQPDTFEIDNPYATSWRIAGLETGKTWYVRVRAIQDNGDGRVCSSYSAQAEINLASSPEIPTLTLSHGIIAEGQGFTATWEFTSTDGTPQAEARLYEYDGTNYTQIAKTVTEEYADLPGWDTAGTRQICVEVLSESGQLSEKSGLVSITVANPVTCSMTNSLSSVTDTDKGEIKVLTALPLTVTVDGAGTGGTTSVMIRRAEEYRVERPDGTVRGGYQDETIFNYTQTGDNEISIGIDDLIGTLDDGGRYTLTAMVIDGIGQVATTEEVFEVQWAHQALTPSGDVIIDHDYKIAVLMPKSPLGAISSDRCDIYRLSADRPVLVYKGAEFGEKYVDPYPAIGEYGGYRFVFVTAEGDYKTTEGVEAFYDAEDEHLHHNSMIIDFDGDRVELSLELDISSDFDKKFVQKEYLGGAIRGYWKAGIGRDTSIGAVAIPSTDEELLTSMRALSEYLGACHVRTPEGSSFAANVKVSEVWDAGGSGKVVKFSLKTTRIEPEEYDGMTYEVWEGGQQ